LLKSFIELAIYCLVAIFVAMTGLATVGEAMGAMALGIVVGTKNNKGGR